MNEKEAIKTLIRIAENQQKIITKLAQELGQAGGPSHTNPDPALPFVPGDAPPDNTAPTHADPAHAAPKNQNESDANAILHALPPALKSAISVVEVHASRDPAFDGEIRVRFAPGKASAAAFKALESVVKSLQKSNVLKGASYSFKQVA